MISFGLFFLFTATLCGGITLRAFMTQPSFYQAAMYLSVSHLGLAWYALFAATLFYAVGKLVRFIFLGNFREHELQLIIQQSKRAAVDTLLIVTAFRNDIDIPFALLFGTLLFCSVFRWVSSARLQFLGQIPVLRPNVIFRLGALLALLAFVTLRIALRCFSLFIEDGSVYYIFFGTKFVVVTIRSVFNIILLILHLIKLLRFGTWEIQGVLPMFIKLFSRFLELCVSVIFCGFVFVHSTIPIHSFSDIYHSVRKIISLTSNIVRYKRMLSHMDEWFPDVMVSDFPDSDSTCAVCREDMIVAKRLSCGHMFHRHCLLAWIERNNACPLCRKAIVSAAVTNPERQAPEVREMRTPTPPPPPPHPHVFSPGTPISPSFPLPPGMVPPMFTPPSTALSSHNSLLSSLMDLRGHVDEVIHLCERTSQKRDVSVQTVEDDELRNEYEKVVDVSKSSDVDRSKSESVINGTVVDDVDRSKSEAVGHVDEVSSSSSTINGGMTPAEIRRRRLIHVGALKEDEQ